MKTIKYFLIIFAVIAAASCGKKDENTNSENPGMENQSSTQNVIPHNESAKKLSDAEKKWTGQYAFDESVPNVAGDGSQTWGYVIDITSRGDTALVASIQVDGFQTMTRLEADVKADDKKAEFIFGKYLPENMFELYKKGDRLFYFELNDKNEIITNWDKLKPNVPGNQKSGKVMFKKISA